MAILGADKTQCNAQGNNNRKDKGQPRPPDQVCVAREISYITNLVNEKQGQVE